MAGSPDRTSESSSRARLELALVIMTGLANVAFESFELKPLLIGLSAGFWFPYAGLRLTRDPTLLSAWGLGLRGLAPALAMSSIVFVILTGCLAAIAFQRGTLTVGLHLWLILLLYPIWGIIQQFLLQALGARHVYTLTGHRWLAALVTVTLFALAHWPDRWLMASTALLATCFTPIYLRTRNLWPLGVFHGWLGALMYSWVLGRDPWAEMFQ